MQVDDERDLEQEPEQPICGVDHRDHEAAATSRSSDGDADQDLLLAGSGWRLDQQEATEAAEPANSSTGKP